jgi:hypothetical protein
MTDTCRVVVLTTLIFLVSGLVSFGVMAEGPEYEKGQGLVHNTSCTPPTTRAPNADGEQLPITEAELDHADVTLYSGGDLFTAATLVEGPVQTDIFCNHSWSVDNYPADQYYVFATITDTEGRESEISLKGGPFSSFVTVMPPAAPVMVR